MRRVIQFSNTMNHELFTIAVLYFTSFFAIINPLGVMPVFMTMTADLTDKQRKKTALKAVFTAFITLLLFAFSGQLMFRFFGISVDGFRVVGGIIFFIMGFDLLQARISKIKMDEEMVKKYVDDISVTPLGIPIIAGPGAITNAIVLMEDSAHLSYPDHYHHPWPYIRCIAWRRENRQAAGRNREQNHHETDGIDYDGDCGGVFLRWS